MFRFPRQSSMSLLIGFVFGCSIIAILSKQGSQRCYETTKFNQISNQQYKKEKDLYDKVRVLCWVMTNPENHGSKALAVKETWGPRCNILLFMSSVNDTKLPTIGLPGVGEGREELWGKTREAFRYVWEHYQDEADWFFKADDDTYVIVENLRYFLSAYNASKPLYFGNKFKLIVDNGYISGGAGYVLSKEATRRFVTQGYNNKSICRQDHGGAEDVEMGICMQNLNISAMDTRDSLGRHRFFTFGADFHYFPGGMYSEDHWHWDYIYYPPTEGRNCCSDTTVSFHYIDPNTMYILDLFLYQIRPYGLLNNRPAIPEPPPDVNLTAPRWFAPPKPTPPPPPTTIPTSTKSTTTLKPNTSSQTSLKLNITSQTSAPVTTKKVEDQRTVASNNTTVNGTTAKKN
ncbi:hypothetical protein GHT06_015823 [Daphnia sinensis]|uniref:Glycoprotein-N-acetylgalactosamine 3-beta-galactosyltransferase 1 n=1 Tax=Daphnia sinensis TaxID=1820382 RepID=A0AAD5PWI7_9CRUS|nr:hypothetical protein GHT06_015823 [Daphnia sinensis]